jgi:hypothetical protein
MVGDELDVLEELAAVDGVEELLVAEEPVFAPVLLPATLFARRRGHRRLDLRHALDQLVNQRALAGARRARHHEHRRPALGSHH